MEASRVCPAAGQMLESPRLPWGATERLDVEKTAAKHHETSSVFVS